MRRILNRTHRNTPRPATPEGILPAPDSSTPVFASFPARHLVIGCGVAIFHVASEKVVVCYHPLEGYWFLPKGRRDAGESSNRAAEREGFEESGYRNRLLPLPIVHHQPLAHHPSTAEAYSPYVTEPVWTQLIPQSTRTQYLLQWYIAETLPPVLEARLSVEGPRPYREPPLYPSSLSLTERVLSEPKGYEPPRHEGTGVNEDELCYQSFLLPIEEARRRLSRTSSVMAEVVRTGWLAITQRLREEESGGESLYQSVSTNELAFKHATEEV